MQLKRRRTPLYAHLADGLVSLSYTRLFGIWLGLMLLFGLAYAGLSFVEGHGPLQIRDLPLWSRLWNAVYFSIITGTSTGYGDITPQGFSKVLASLQSIIALLVFAVFVSKLVSQRQEIALEQVHRLAFAEFLHKIREGLFLVRKDFDECIRALDEGKALTDGQWANTETALSHAETLLEELLVFYERDSIYAIAPMRERLLVEAVERTIRRIGDFAAKAEERGLHEAAGASWHAEMRRFAERSSQSLREWRRGLRNAALEPRLAEIHRILEGLTRGDRPR